MKKYEHLRKKALEWRRNGMAIGEICEKLSLGKSTVYHWIKDIPIERTEKQTEGQKAGTKAMQQKYAKIRNDSYNEALNEASKRLQDHSFRDFVMLYLTEGYRRTRNCVSVSNSNLCLMRLAAKWMRQLSEKEISYAIQYHVDQDLDELRAYWSEGLGIEAERIKFQRKSNSGKMDKRKWRSQYGVLTARVSDTVLRSKMQAWMDVLQDEINRVW